MELLYKGKTKDVYKLENGNVMKKISYWIDHTDDDEKRKELVKQFKQRKGKRSL